MATFSPLEISGIGVDDTLKKAEAILSGAEELSPAVRALVEQPVFRHIIALRI